MAAYAKRRDLYRYGLPRGTLGAPGCQVDTSSSDGDLLVLDDHGFEDDDQILIRATAGGSLAEPLAEDTVYYAIRVSSSTFKLSLTEGGMAIPLTTEGVSMIVSTPLPFDEVLEFYSRFVDPFLPAHLVPLEPDADDNYPVVVTAIVAELSAKKLQLLSGVTSVSVSEAEVAAKAQLERWAKGIPLRDTKATASANLAVTVSASGSAADPRGWGSGCLP